MTDFEKDTAEGPARLLLADDHRLFREGVASLLERVEDVELIGEAGNGEEAIRLAEDLLPDVVLMDLNMPGTNGIEATRAMIERSPHIGIIIVTMVEDDASVFAALTAGARGYVLKDADRGVLLRAIRAVARGEALLSAPIAQRVLHDFNQGGSKPARGLSLAQELTPRELEVLDLIAQGLKNREIAQRLFITEKTVGNHISNIFTKLQVADRVEAVIRAREAGLGG